jgi:hypothetical protein
MALSLKKIDYNDLNPRQKENFNFAKISSVLADYGFITMRVSDDWQGADFIAQHRNGEFIKVRLKGRLSFGTKYKAKDLYVTFCADGEWYLFPHDEVLERVLTETTIGQTRSWSEDGGYSFPGLTMQMRQILGPYKVGETFGIIERKAIP